MIISNTCHIGLDDRAQNLREIFGRSQQTYGRLSSKIRQHNSSPIVQNCYCCNTTIGTNREHSLCTSHSIPQHCLSNITDSGKLVALNTFIDFPARPSMEGRKQCGTFRLICRACDTKVFSKYENFSVYTENFETLAPYHEEQIILNQIAMKNSLSSLYDALQSASTFQDALNYITENGSRHSETPLKQYLQVSQDDAIQYNRIFKETQKISHKNNIHNVYRIGFYRIIPHQMQVAFQGLILPRQDFDGSIIYDGESEKQFNPLHVCIFPDKERTILLAFCKSKCVQYRSLLRTIRAMDDDDAAKALIALSINYSSNFYISDRSDIEKGTEEYKYLQHLAGDDGTYFTGFQMTAGISTSHLCNISKQCRINAMTENQPLYTQFHLIPNSFIEP
ncbi:hypothetical protein [Bifidobacterium animalis]|nr:hypothetical protein [Bifidobacterium animalis]